MPVCVCECRTWQIGLDWYERLLEYNALQNISGKSAPTTIYFAGPGWLRVGQAV